MLICNQCKNPATENSFLCEECLGMSTLMQDALHPLGYICTCDDEMCANCKKFQELGIRTLEHQEGSF